MVEFEQYNLPEVFTQEQFSVIQQQIDSSLGNAGITNREMKSPNFQEGARGWRIKDNGDVEFNDGNFRGDITGASGTFTGSVTATSGAIGGFDIGADYLRDAANSFGLASTVSGSDDVRFWAGDTFANRATADFRVTEAGAVTASNMTITGGAVSGASLSGIPNSTATDISLMEKTHNLVFSVTDADTIAWASGTIAFSNGRTFTISAGNTGNMSALTYIYLDPAVSSTVLQVTTTYSTAIGANKVLLGTAQNHTITAHFIPYGPGQPLIDGSNIGALSIVAGNIAASTITAGKLSVSTLSAISADMGTLTAGTITLDTAGYVRGGQTDYATGTGFFLGYSGAYKFSIGSATDYLTWNGTVLTINSIDDKVIFKAADETVTATQALQNDDDFTFAVAANTNYLIDMMIFWNFTTSAGDGVLEFNFSLPAGATYDAQLVTPSTGSGVSTISEAADAEAFNEPGGTLDLVTTIRGVIRNGANAGTATWKWGADKNNPADTVTVKVYKGSWIHYKKQT